MMDKKGRLKLFTQVAVALWLGAVTVGIGSATTGFLFEDDFSEGLYDGYWDGTDSFTTYLDEEAEPAHSVVRLGRDEEGEDIVHGNLSLNVGSLDILNLEQVEISEYLEMSVDFKFIGGMGWRDMANISLNPACESSAVRCTGRP